MAKITLTIYNKDGSEEEKTFHQPTKIKGSALRAGFKLDKKMTEIDNDPEADYDDLLDEMYQFVAEHGYNNQFTASEYEDGVDSRDILDTTRDQIAKIISRGQVNSGKGHPAKKQ